MLKPKRDGSEIGMRIFAAADDRRFLVFRSLEGSFHVFTEVEAKEAARACGAPDDGNTRTMWEYLWDSKV